MSEADIGAEEICIAVCVCVCHNGAFAAACLVLRAQLSKYIIIM